MSGKEPTQIKGRIMLVYGVMVLFAVAIAGKLFTIQLLEADKWSAMASQVSTTYRVVQPDRGHIFSEDGRLLATSVPEYEVRMDMAADGLTNALFHDNLDSLCNGLAAILKDRSAQELRRDLLDARARGDRYHLLKRRVDHDQVQRIRELPLLRLGRNMSGLIIEKRTVRVRPFGRLASRTVGYVLRDSSAIGLEAAYDPWLKGTTGRRLERRLTGGVWMPIENGNGVDPKPGSDIHTTIDINLQDLADAALEAQLRKHGAHHGCVVVMEVATGHVKAISNLTRMGDSTYVEDLNYAIGQATEPGSTFKLASLMVALEDGLVEPTDSVDTKRGKVRFHDRIMSDSKEGGYGRITVQRAFELSSNTAISQVVNNAYASQPQRFIDGLRRMGFGEKMGMPIPGEAQPKLGGPGKQGWSGVSLPWMSIGYEVTMTPMQILAFYNAVANDGKLVEPRFVSHVSRNGKVVERFKPNVLVDRICSQRTLEKVRPMLEGVVDSGTATNLRAAHFRIAGKTGTAQIAKNSAGYKGDGVSYLASFVGYFPAEAPRYSCIVMVSAPTSFAYYGNVVAGPIFRDIADKIHANRLELQPPQEQQTLADRSMPVSFSGHAAETRTVLTALGVPFEEEGEGEWMTTQASDSLVVLQPRGIPGHGQGLVPNVVGMGLRDALFLLENCGLRVQTVGAGMVKRQSLQPGTRYNDGSHIRIELS